MVVERRLSILISAAVAFILLTALWNAFVRPARPVRAGPPAAAPPVVVPAENSATARDSAARAASTAPAPPPAPAAAMPTPPATGPAGDAGGARYIVLLGPSASRPSRLA